MLNSLSALTVQSILRVLPGAVADGLIWGILALGVYVTFRLLDFPDMSVEGTFALGGCVTATLITNGVHVSIAMLVAVLAGALGGALTGVLHTKLKIHAILAGILTMFALYSVNVHVLGGKTSLSLLGTNTMCNFLMGKGLSNVNANLVIAGIAVAVTVAFLYWLFGTKLGSAVRATGCNQDMARAQGIDTDMHVIAGLAISNALSALAGSLWAQSNNDIQVNAGSGAIVFGLTGIVLGEVFIKERYSFWLKLSFVALGSVLYRLIIAVAIKVVSFITMDDLKLISALIIILVLAVKYFSKNKTAVKEKRHA